MQEDVAFCITYDYNECVGFNVLARPCVANWVVLYCVVNRMWCLYYVLSCTVSVSLCTIMIAGYYMNGLTSNEFSMS